MSTQVNERYSIAIDVSAADQTVNFNSLYVTTAGTLKYDDAFGNTITIATSVPVGKLEIAGSKIYKTGTSLVGVALDYYSPGT